jgi:hypothetical protein
VQHHFGLAGGAAREINDAGVIAAGRFGFEGRVRLPKAALQVDPPRPIAAGQYAKVESEAVGFAGAVGIGDDGTGSGGCEPIGEVFGRELGGSRHRDRAEPNEAKQADPPGRYPRKLKENPVSGTDSKLMKETGRASKLGA